MPEFKTEKLTKHVTRIYAFATELMYLVEGSEKAALLDTGSGIGSLKKCVERLTDKPIIVLLTHGHVDHAMGAGEFDEVYMNHADDYIYLEHAGQEFRKAGLNMSQYKDQMTQEDFIPSKPCEDIRDMKDGDIFDLGDVTIEIHACPGHTKGSVVMLIREERSVLLGDACNPFTFLYDYYSTSVTEYRDSLYNLQSKLKGKYDTVYLSHGNGTGNQQMVEEVIEVCEDIIHGNTDDIPFEFLGSGGLIAKAVLPEGGRSDGKQGNIIYNKNKIGNIKPHL